MIEAYHLLNLFTASDYMRICRVYMYSNTATHEQNQEYIRLSGKIMEQYSKGILSLKMYREGLPQINKVHQRSTAEIKLIKSNNYFQNNTLNQVNINKMDEKPKEIGFNDGLDTEKIVINKKEEV